MDLFKISILNKILKLSNKSILEKKILEKSKQPGRFVSNLGGYQSHNLDIEDQDLKELITKLNTEVSHLANYYEFKDELKVKEIWFNTNRYKDFNAVHYHKDSIFSGVYYFDVPENTGGIVFRNPTINYMDLYWPNHIIKEHNNMNTPTWEIHPVTDQVLIFPAWLEHSVNPNMNKNKDRISMSFNFHY